jgi:hypothetical protein
VSLPGRDLEGRYPALARVVTLIGDKDFATAFDELGRLLESEDADVRPRALLLLGRINQARGDMARAMEAYALAADSGHPEVGPFACLIVGEALLGLGKIKPARQLLRRARRAADADTRRLAEAALERTRRRWRAG